METMMIILISIILGSVIILGLWIYAAYMTDDNTSSIVAKANEINENTRRSITLMVPVRKLT